MKGIQASIESGYVDGRPRHHHPSARDRTFNREEPLVSTIFVVEYTDFILMPAEEVQEIFRHRHILVVNAPLLDEGFSIRTLKRYANVDRLVSIVGSYSHILDVSNSSPPHP